MKAPAISELRTIATLQTNAPKIIYGSGVVGAGRKDVYQTFKQLRGKFYQDNSNRGLGEGTVRQEATYKLVTRYERAVMEVIDLQVRFLINGKTYTLNSYDVEVMGKTAWFSFTLLQFGK
jgi:uncharacterized membrane protein YcjF (UPF0283 family)